MDTSDDDGRWADLDTLLLRGGHLVGPGFEPGPELKSMLLDDIRVLVRAESSRAAGRDDGA